MLDVERGIGLLTLVRPSADPICVASSQLYPSRLTPRVPRNRRRLESHPACIVSTKSKPVAQPHLTSNLSNPPNVSFIVDDLEDTWAFGPRFDFIFSRFMTGSISNWPEFFRKSYEYISPYLPLPPSFPNNSPLADPSTPAASSNSKTPSGAPKQTMAPSRPTPTLPDGLISCAAAWSSSDARLIQLSTTRSNSKKLALWMWCSTFTSGRQIIGPRTGGIK
jgi:hypothetical protein